MRVGMLASLVLAGTAGTSEGSIPQALEARTPFQRLKARMNSCPSRSCSNRAANEMVTYPIPCEVASSLVHFASASWHGFSLPLFLPVTVALKSSTVQPSFITVFGTVFWAS